MHLTANTEPTAKRRLSKLSLRIDLHGRTCLCPDSIAPTVVERSTSIFLSRVTNFLEWRRDKFHYYVIDGDATFSLVGRLGWGHPPNDEVPSLNSRVVSPGAAARGGDR